MSLPTVDSWIHSGCPGIKNGVGKGGGWTFDTAEVAKWRMQQAAADAGGDDVKDERAIKRRRAEIGLKAETLDLAKQMGLVAPIDDFERAQAKVFALLRQGIMTVPARVSASLVGERNELRIKKVLTDELTAALKKVADADMDLVDNGDDDSDSDDE